MPIREEKTAASLDTVLPDDERWNEARQAWNLSVDQWPAAIVFPESAADVAATIRLAADRGNRIAAQGTGHNAAPLGSLDDTILLKTDRMRDVTIDPQARIARVGAGVIWSEVVEAAAEHGLAALAGSSPDVGVIGYTLGGGLSLLGRKYGAAANHVRAIELVTADGRFLRVDRDHEPDLFWALRGGGGSFGVVTAMELQLFPITEAYAGVLWYPLERAHEVLRLWRDLTYAAPDDLTTIGRLMVFPPLPEVPEEARGKSFALVEVYHVGEPAQADALLAPLRSIGPIQDTIQTVPMPAMTAFHMDPPEPAPGTGDGVLLAALPDAALEAWIDVAAASATPPLNSVEVRHLAGEFARARPDDGAISSVQAAGYMMFAGAFTPTAELVDQVRAELEAVQEAMAPWATDRLYLNFSESKVDPATLWSETDYRRLRRIKAEFDPDDLIRSNHPIPPAT